MEFETARLHPLFAAELRGVDIARADAALIAMVEDLMREYAVVCIRGQSHIDDEQQLAFAIHGQRASGRNRSFARQFNQQGSARA